MSNHTVSAVDDEANQTSTGSTTLSFDHRSMPSNAMCRRPFCHQHSHQCCCKRLRGIPSKGRTPAPQAVWAVHPTVILCL